VASRSAVTWLILLPTIAAAGWLAMTIPPSSPPRDQASSRLTAEMEQVSDRIGLSDEGRAIFADTRPRLLDSADFHDACGSAHESSEDRRWAVVGCYYWSGGESGRIAIFRPADERLADQIVVTAAHELLHAAYAGLSPDELERLDPLLEERWSSVPVDDPIQASLASSVGIETENRATEQFAYLGTEIADAGDPALDAFYAPYFIDRQAVVAIDGARDALWTGLWSDFSARADALAEHEQADADATAQAGADRAGLATELTAHNDQVSQYNALPAAQQDRLVVQNADGTPGDEPWGDYLRRRGAEITAAESELAGRQAPLDASVSAAQGERLALEALEAELRALEAAAVPAPA
jgi:hypothetical protein